MERENSRLHGRNPTSGKELETDAAKREMRKKLYRNRTRDEVGKAVSRVTGTEEDLRERLDGDGKEADESTVDMTVNTAKRTGGELAEYARSYSNKLNSERSENRVKKSDSLREKEHERSEELKETGYDYNPEDARGPAKSGGQHTKLKSERSKTPGAGGNAGTKGAEKEAGKEAKRLQKERIKREYAKAAREAEKGAATAGGKTVGKAGEKGAEETASLVSKGLAKVADFVTDHPIAAIVIFVILLLVILIPAFVGLISLAISGGGTGVVSTSFVTEDTEIYAVEAKWNEMETRMQGMMDRMKENNPDYDEYRFSFDGLSHDPWKLAALLTVIYGEYSEETVKEALPRIFDMQYKLTKKGYKETRYRQEERIEIVKVPVYDEDGHIIGYEEKEQTVIVYVPYDYYILEASFTNNGFDSVVEELIGTDEDSMELYNYLVETKGGKEYLW